MAIAFPYTFAALSGNIPASDLDSNFTYTGTLPSQATTVTSAAYTLVGTETILINAGSTPYSCTLAQFASATGIGTAVKLQTARTIAITGDVTYTSGGFDGSANVTGTGTVVSASTSTAGKVQLAQASDVTTGTSTTLAVTPASLSGLSLNPKAFVRFAGQVTNGACVITKGFNVASVSRTAAGTYTITFTTNLADANYSIIPACQYNVSGTIIVGLTYNVSPTVSSFSITSSNLGNSGTDSSVYCVAVFD